MLHFHVELCFQFQFVIYSDFRVEWKEIKYVLITEMSDFNAI